MVVSASQPTFSRASLLDLFGAWRLERACFSKDAYDLATLAGMALSPGLANIKVMADGRLVGYCACDVRERGGACWIITIGVLPEYQGRGIGAQLLAHAEQAMRQRGQVAKLTVRRSNARAIHLYERHGYKWVTTYARYYADGEDGLVMEKAL